NPGVIATVGLNGGTVTVLADQLSSPYLTAVDSTYVYTATQDQGVVKGAKTHTNLSTNPAPPPPPRRMNPGAGVLSGRPSLMSCNGGRVLYMHNDGHVVLYTGGVAIWSSATVGSFADRLIMQADGNLVAYNQTGSAPWSTGTVGYGGAFLTLDNAGLGVRNSAGTTFLWQADNPLPQTQCGELFSGQGLRPGVSLLSCDGRFTLVMQGDGNLVLFSNLTGVLWSAGTAGNPLAYAYVQTNGRF